LNVLKKDEKNENTELCGICDETFDKKISFKTLLKEFRLKKQVQAVGTEQEQPKNQDIILENYCCDESETKIDVSNNDSIIQSTKSDFLKFLKDSRKKIKQTTKLDQNAENFEEKIKDVNLLLHHECSDGT